MKSELLQVFVQLGSNPAPTLLHFSTIARSQLEKATLVLITNKPENWATFPGRVITYSSANRHPSISRLIRRFKERDQNFGGYWMYTLERIFALKILSNFYSIDTPILHFESDCYSLVNNQISEELQRRCTKVSVPRYNLTQGIASILFSPNLSDLNLTIDKLGETLDQSKSWLGDMELLGIALNTGLVRELPTLLSQAWDITPKKSGVTPQKLIFDGLAIGQYLLGQDPHHTGGYAIPGHINKNFLDKISEWKWDIKPTEFKNNQYLGAQHDNVVYRVANIHVHSKILIPPLDKNNSTWGNVINTANKIHVITPIKMPENKIYTQKITKLNQLRNARHDGLKQMMRSVLGPIYVRLKCFFKKVE